MDLSDVQLSVFSCLDVVQLSICSRVCTKWRATIKAYLPRSGHSGGSGSGGCIFCSVSTAPAGRGAPAPICLHSVTSAATAIAVLKRDDTFRKIALSPQFRILIRHTLIRDIPPVGGAPPPVLLAAAVAARRNRFLRFVNALFTGRFALPPVPGAGAGAGAGGGAAAGAAGMGGAAFGAAGPAPANHRAPSGSASLAAVLQRIPALHALYRERQIAVRERLVLYENLKELLALIGSALALSALRSLQPRRFYLPIDFSFQPTTEHRTYRLRRLKLLNLHSPASVVVRPEKLIATGRWRFIQSGFRSLISVVSGAPGLIATAAASGTNQLVVHAPRPISLVLRFLRLCVRTISSHRTLLIYGSLMAMVLTHYQWEQCERRAVWRRFKRQQQTRAADRLREWEKSEAAEEERRTQRLTSLSLNASTISPAERSVPGDWKDEPSASPPLPTPSPQPPAAPKSTPPPPAEPSAVVRLKLLIRSYIHRALARAGVLHRIKPYLPAALAGAASNSAPTADEASAAAAAECCDADGAAVAKSELEMQRLMDQSRFSKRMADCDRETAAVACSAFVRRSLNGFGLVSSSPLGASLLNDSVDAIRSELRQYCSLGVVLTILVVWGWAVRYFFLVDGARLVWRGLVLLFPVIRLALAQQPTPLPTLLYPLSRIVFGLLMIWNRMHWPIVLTYALDKAALPAYNQFLRAIRLLPAGASTASFIARSAEPAIGTRRLDVYNRLRLIDPFAVPSPLALTQYLRAVSGVSPTAIGASTGAAADGIAQPPLLSQLYSMVMAPLRFSLPTIRFPFTIRSRLFQSAQTSAAAAITSVPPTARPTVSNPAPTLARSVPVSAESLLRHRHVPYIPSREDRSQVFFTGIHRLCPPTVSAQRFLAIAICLTHVYYSDRARPFRSASGSYWLWYRFHSLVCGLYFMRLAFRNGFWSAVRAHIAFNVCSHLAMRLYLSHIAPLL